MSEVRQILADLVTTHMRPDATRLFVGQTVHEALDHIQKNPGRGRVVYYYVVDEGDRLRGVVPTRRLLQSGRDQPIADIMVERVIAIPHTASVLDACEFFTLHKLLAFPVVDDDRRLIGVVDIDLYTEELRDIDRRQDSDDLFQLIGVHLTEAAQKDPRQAFIRRFPWLLCNVGGGMLAALLADAFQDVATLVLVTPFIALVTAMAESVSIQSVSLALLSLHGRKPTWQTFADKLGFEALVGLFLGAACGLLVGVIAYFWKGSARAGLSLFLGIAGGVAASAAIGLVLPYVLRLLRRDPQVASGPIALTLSDMVTLFLYFNVGRWLLT
jgi:magnesium transporter